MKRNTITAACAAILVSIWLYASPGALAYPASVLASVDVEAPENPAQIPLRVGNLSSAIAMGLVAGPGATSGVLAGSATASGRDTRLSENAASQNLRVADELAAAICDALKRKGFNAQPRSNAAQAQPATARITFTIEEVAYERRAWGKIGPKLTVRVRAYESPSDDRIFSDTYKYDMYAQTLGWTMLRPPEQYGFDEADDVLAHPDVAIAGLRTGITMIADRLVDDFLADVDN